MRCLRVVSLVALLAVCVVPVSMTANSEVAVESADFYVSPWGNDLWSGTVAAPKADGSDGPVATVERTQKLVRELRAAQPGRKRPLVEEILTRLKLKYGRLAGSVPQKKRQQLVNEFQTQPGCRLFITTNAGSTGLNLQAANTVSDFQLHFPIATCSTIWLLLCAVANYQAAVVTQQPPHSHAQAGPALLEAIVEYPRVDSNH